MLLDDAGEIVDHIALIGSDLQRPFVPFARAFQVSQLLLHDSQIHMRLLGVGTNAHRFAIGLGRFRQVIALLLGHAQIEPALKVIRRELHQLGAQLRGGFEIARMERAGREAFQRRLRMRAQRQQLLGVFLDGVVVLAGHADRNQIHQAFLGLRVLPQQLQVERGGFIELPQQLERDRLAEQRRLVGRIARQHAIEADDGRLRLLLVQQADSQAQLCLGAIGVGVQRLLERFGGFVPAAQLLVADTQVEAGGGVARRQRQELLIALNGVLILLQLVLEMALGGINLRALFAIFKRRVQFLQRVFMLAFEVQRHRPRQRGRDWRDCLSASGLRRGLRSCLMYCAHSYQLPSVVGML